MSMRYEGAGIALNIDRILRCILASFVSQGQTQFKIGRELLEDEPWINYDLSSFYDDNAYGWIITVSDRRGGGFTSRVKFIEAIPEAEYEVVTEAPLLPAPPKLLKP